ncbi:MAG: hypothetical protein ABL901_05140 [Hyphomicrobiaceae bacterium]
MTTPTLSAIALLGVVVIGAVVLPAEENSAGLIAANFGLTAEQSEAFRSCRSQMAGRGLVSHNEHGTVQRYTVPDEICVCQSRNMAAMLKPGHYDEHRRVIDYKSGATGAHMFAPVVLKTPSGDGIESFERLADQLATCTADYQRQQEAKTNQVKQKLMQQHAGSRH